MHNVYIIYLAENYKKKLNINKTNFQITVQLGPCAFLSLTKPNTVVTEQSSNNHSVFYIWNRTEINTALN